jgi:hypothetical protein
VSICFELWDLPACFFYSLGEDVCGGKLDYFVVFFSIYYSVYLITFVLLLESSEHLSFISSIFFSFCLPFFLFYLSFISEL